MYIDIFKKKELEMIDFCQYDSIVDVIHGSIPISGLERMVISSPLYNRMHRILQNSMAYLTFPCNKTKRFEHGIGTMFLAGEVYFNSIVNAQDAILLDFFKEVKDEIHNWYKNASRMNYTFLSEEYFNFEGDESVINSPLSSSKVPLYRKYFPLNVGSENFFPYIVAFEAIRLSGLLHDIGHLPYSHIMEYALKSLYFELKSKKNEENFSQEKLDNFFKVFDKYYKKGENCELHEAIGKKIVSILRENILLSFSTSNNIDENEALIACVSMDFAIKILNSEESDNNIFSDLHKIISGTIDADRLDYCSRDFYSVGLGKGIIDYVKLFNTYELLKVENTIVNGREFYFSFCPSTKSLKIVEDLLYRRWKIYVDINYHHRVQKIHELMIHSVKEIAILYLKNKEEKKEARTNNYISLGMEAIWDMLDLMVNQKSPKAMEMKLIQLDDSWFDTMVKHQFAILFKNPLSKSKNKLWLQLHEFVSTEKHYHSLIKQTDDFYEFDRELSKELSNLDFSDIILKIDNLDLTSKDGICEKRPSKLKLFISQITSKDFDYDHYMATNHSFIFNIINSELSLIEKGEQMVLEMKTDIPSYIIDGDKTVVDIIVSTFDIKTGYNPNIPIYLSKHSKNSSGYISIPQEFETMSTIYNSIKDEKCIFPGFYLYVSSTGNINKHDILKKCAKKISEIFQKCILEYLEETEKMVPKSEEV